MISFLKTLKKNIEQMQTDYLASGKPPVLFADKSILDKNNVSIEEFIEFINPYCTVISHYVISDSNNKLADKGIPEGAHVRAYIIVGHNEYAKETLWEVFCAEESLCDSDYYMNQLLLYSGTKITKSKICITTNDGPVIRENTY